MSRLLLKYGSYDFLGIRTLGNIVVATVSGGLILFNIWFYQYLADNQKQEYQRYLAGFQENIRLGLVNNLKEVITSGYGHEAFNNFLNVHLEENLTLAKKDELNITPYSIEILNGDKKITLDLIQVREYLSKLLPSYVAYRASINNVEFATFSYVNSIYHSSVVYDLGTKVQLQMELGIVQNSRYYITAAGLLYKRVQLCLIISVFLVIFIWHIKNRLVWQAEKLEVMLSERERVINNFNLHKTLEKQLNNLFIQKATDLFIKEAGESVNVVDSGGKHKYLFPLSLYDSSASEINLEDFVGFLKGYFAHYSQDIALDIKTVGGAINIGCAQEVFYQLLFSVIRNIILIIREQTSGQKSIIIEIDADKVLVSYQGFPLTKDSLIRVSGMVNLSKPSPFLLDFEGIFKSLEKHSLEYSLFRDGQVNFLKVMVNKNTDETFTGSNVVRFPEKRGKL